MLPVWVHTQRQDQIRVQAGEHMQQVVASQDIFSPDRSVECNKLDALAVSDAKISQLISTLVIIHTLL